jgi:hypothetical protein
MAVRGVVQGVVRRQDLDTGPGTDGVQRQCEALEAEDVEMCVGRANEIILLQFLPGIETSPRTRRSMIDNCPSTFNLPSRHTIFSLCTCPLFPETLVRLFC